MKKIIKFVILGVLLLITILLVIGSLEDKEAASNPNNFKLQNMAGKEVNLSDFKGKTVFLNFWATWCPPCKGEMPDIQKLYDETKDEDIVILAVNVGDDKETVKDFLDTNGYTFSILLDTTKKTAEKYNINGIPTTFIIDKEGNIVYKNVGAVTLSQMKEMLKKSK